MDGQILAIHKTKVQAIAPLEEMSVLEGRWLMHTISVASMLELKFRALMLKLLQDNGNSELGHVKELKLATISGWQDTCFRSVRRLTALQPVLNLIFTPEKAVQAA